MNDDPFAFAYDKTVVDKSNSVTVSVTVTDADDDAVQITIKPVEAGFTIAFFLGLIEAAALAKMLQDASFR